MGIPVPADPLPSDSNTTPSPAPIDSSRGEVDQHIINGQPAAPGAHPYACNLQVRQGSQWRFICGAAILNQINILTAAHCVDFARASSFRVTCGDSNRVVNEGTEQTRAIVAKKTHPRWRNNPRLGFPNDIALLRMASPLQFNSFVNNLRLATRTTRLPVRCTIVGYGVTETGRASTVLREANTNRLSTGRCRGFWGRYIRSGNICFLDYTRPLSSACNGDSGGPANCGGFLAGITSWGARGCPPNRPSAYTRISTYFGWIRRNAFK